jgi:hypothetical protein
MRVHHIGEETHTLAWAGGVGKGSSAVKSSSDPLSFKSLIRIRLIVVVSFWATFEKTP